MIGKWYKSLDTGGHADALITDFSRAFDSIGHELLVAKLNTYDFGTKYLFLP